VVGHALVEHRHQARALCAAVHFGELLPERLPRHGVPVGRVHGPMNHAGNASALPPVVDAVVLRQGLRDQLLPERLDPRRAERAVTLDVRFAEVDHFTRGDLEPAAVETVEAVGRREDVAAHTDARRGHPPQLIGRLAVLAAELQEIGVPKHTEVDKGVFPEPVRRRVGVRVREQLRERGAGVTPPVGVVDTLEDMQAELRDVASARVDDGPQGRLGAVEGGVAAADAAVAVALGAMRAERVGCVGRHRHEARRWQEAHAGIHPAGTDAEQTTVGPDDGHRAESACTAERHDGRVYLVVWRVVSHHGTRRHVTAHYAATCHVSAAGNRGARHGDARTAPFST